MLSCDGMEDVPHSASTRHIFQIEKGPIELGTGDRLETGLREIEGRERREMADILHSEHSKFAIEIRYAAIRIRRETLTSCNSKKKDAADMSE